MKRAIVMMAAVLGVSLMGCGGADLATPNGEVVSEEVQDVSQELVTCTATCYGGTSVSCTGTTCSYVNNQSVTCDGVVHYCPPTICPGTYRPCFSLSGRRCSQHEPCCRGDVESYCACYNGKLSC
ncbi:MULTISPECIES: hypothetical protein [Myxococcus]|uniref:Lipoprotein n=1 Tax=Myxococcus llanfairpwllgwyngyllgogerychwyrndrobwllllantysiliogogogochensis TaxID=2590453 RepID=A0A540WLK9_9BACT|nr:MULTISPECIES: hypothetical protein [Myxococcus]NTX04423.1 hypothetical protein [Myxococcus sp. CA040A]TQF09898.1 hypothetical protein FJV41_42275 [Myxococcus llanfairpwllgwyngyllgogerychwyrndrobwllllantysiliogogogochensis]